MRISFPNAALCLSLLVLSALFSGCAPTSTTIMDEEVVTNPKPMSTYKSLIINEFELKRELYADMPEERMGERERRYAHVPVELTDQIERHVKSWRIYQTVAREGEPSATTLILKGRFIRMGRFKITIEAVLIDGASKQEAAYFRQTLWDVFDTTEAVGRLGREIAGFIDRIQYK